jgi:hypothetical protein
VYVFTRTLSSKVKYCFTGLANVLFQDGEESALDEEKAISVHNPQSQI